MERARTATEIAAAVKRGDLSVSEVVEEQIGRIEAVNDQLNAVIWPLFDEARATARAADESGDRAHGRLFGVPITLKDQFMVRGTPTSCGLAHRSEQPLDSEGPLVTRLRQQGAIILGKTNLPQLLISHECEHGKYGRANNPWNTDRTPGGSSGGEAAIIAAGGSPLGLGGDMGGSLRVPAHCCGIHALKPTSGRFPNDDTPLSQGTFAGLAGFEGFVVQPGPMARSVDDLKLAMDALLDQPLPSLDLAAPSAWTTGPVGDASGLRVGVYTDNHFFGASPALRRLVGEAAETLRTHGLDVQPFEPPDAADGMRIYMSLLESAGAAWVKEALGGERPTDDIQSFMRIVGMPNFLRPLLATSFGWMGQGHASRMLRNRRVADTHGYWQLTAQRSAYRARFLEAMNHDGIDILICPPYGLPAPPHGSNKTGAGGLAASHAALFNLLGMPAGVIAAGRVGANEESDRPLSRDQAERAACNIEKGSAGMPVGVQVVGRHWQEHQVLAVMKVLESHFAGTPDYPRRT